MSQHSSFGESYAPALKFGEPGDKFVFEVLSWNDKDQYDPDTGKTAISRAGNVKRERVLLVRLSAPYRADEADDGQRSLYVKQYSRLDAAVIEARDQTGIDPYETGIWWSVARIADIPANVAGFSATRDYSVDLRRPAAGPLSTLLDGLAI